MKIPILALTLVVLAGCKNDATTPTAATVQAGAEQKKSIEATAPPGQATAPIPNEVTK